MKLDSHKQIKFPNGLTLILQPMPSMYSLAVYVALGAGPRHETKDTSGLAHFLEHMLFEGTKKLPTSKEVADYIERVGGKSGAWTDKEFVIYYAIVPKQNLKIAFDYLAEILFHSVLSSEAIEKEKGIVIEELKRKIDNPEVEIWDLWFEWVWGKDQSLGRSTLGDEATIREITRSKLHSYIYKLYHPANMVISIAGDFDLNEAEKYATKYFGNLHGKNVPSLEKLSFIPKKVRTKVIATDTQQSQLMLGFVTGVSYRHKDRFPMQLVGDILGTGVSSRLFHKLTYELGIAYSTGVYNYFFSDTGLFCTFGGFSAENIKTAIKVILEELERLKKEKVINKELDEAKVKGKSQIYFQHETPDAIANLYAIQQITEKRIMTLEEISNMIDKVTSEDVQRVARKYFNNQNLCLTIRGPFLERNVEQIEKLLE